MRYALIGTGARSAMYYRALYELEDVRDNNQLVALLDYNNTRMELVNRELGLKLPLYKPHQFEEMVKKERVEGIIVTTRDSDHHYYIIQGLKMGLRVITEKPMTIDEKKCQVILDTMEETDSDLIVTFNFRYSPYRSKLKELLQQDIIGRVTMVEFHWYLDTIHGADYYRRWHRNKNNSGSLLVHKATHHFDLVNWWLESYPEKVFALGKKNFYRPETFSPNLRCSSCDMKEDCDFYVDISESTGLRKLYQDAEHEDGYFRDGCVFSPDINIWDTRAVTAGYKNGVILSYSLNNYAPYEGYKVAFIGTKGRIEQDVFETTYTSGQEGEIEEGADKNEVRLEVFPLFDKPYEVKVEAEGSGHGGGDLRLLKDVFSIERPVDPLRRRAGGVDGAMSILTGVAARRSIELGRMVELDELLDFPGDFFEG